MKSNVIKTVLLVFLSTLMVRAEEVFVQYSEDPLLTAKRVVGDTVYYLTLQTNLWHAITATFVRPQTYTSGWVVTGRIDGGTNRSFILKNPPLEAFDQFSRLKARYQEIKPDFTDLQSQADEAARSLEEARLEIQRLHANPGPGIGSQADRDWWVDLVRAYANERNLSAQSINLSDRVDAMKDEMDELKSSGMDLDGDFLFSCFAVLVPQVVENLPVYDHGRIIR